MRDRVGDRGAREQINEYLRDRQAGSASAASSSPS